jgi:hypothetical protein
MKSLHLKIPKHVLAKPQGIWKRPCSFCPAAHYDHTPDTLDMLEWYKKGDVTFEEAAFVCTMRPQKYCRGICNALKNVQREVD